MDGEISTPESAKPTRETEPGRHQADGRAAQPKPPDIDKKSPEREALEQKKQRQEQKDRGRIQEILGDLKGSESQEKPSVLRSKETVDSEARGESYEFYEFALQSGLPLKVVFKGREETIDPEVFNTGHVVHIGKEPQHLPEEKFKEWRSTFDGKENPRIEYMMQQSRLDQYSKDGGLTMMVDQNPESIMEAALVLGAEDPKVREMFHQARTFQYSEGLIEHIDRAIAAHQMQPGGSNEELSSSHDSEALLLTSLVGDKETQQILKTLKGRYDEQYKMDRAKVERELQEFMNEPDRKERWARQREKLDPLRVEDLVAVHATRFYPTFDKELGKWKRKTHFDATDGKVPRTSLHFTMNHVVQSHMYGNWDENPYVVVILLEDLMKENGLPTVLNTVDTYWNLNPGEDLVLPENSWVLAPGPTEGRQLAKGSSVGSIKHKSPDEAVRKVNYPVPDRTKLHDLQRRIDLGILSSGEDGPEEKEQRELNPQHLNEVKEIAEVRDRAVKNLVKALGFEPKSGGRWAWRGRDVTAQTDMLSEDLGITATAHGSTPEAGIEYGVMRYFFNIEEDNEDNIKSRNRISGQINRGWEKLPAQQRRTLWAMGLV